MQNQSFNLDSIKQVDNLGQEYWNARDLMRFLGYGEEAWEEFELAIRKAMQACSNMDLPIDNYFWCAAKTIHSVSGAKEMVANYFLNRRACYLIIMNGDVCKPEIAAAQNYIAFTSEALGSNRRISLCSENLDVAESGPEALAANLFRITQTDAKLKRDQIHDEDTAIATHHDVGREVRRAIENIHQKKPEDLPRAANIRKLVEEKRRKARKKLKNVPSDEQGRLF